MRSAHDFRHWFATDVRAAEQRANAIDIVMTEIKVGVVDVYVIWASPTNVWKVLMLQRSDTTRCPGAWESVHGHVEGDEKPEQAAVREVKEETGLDIARLYNVTVQPFYLHKINTVEMAVVFAAFVDSMEVQLSAEHAAFKWASVHDALRDFAWPRESAALRDISRLVGSGYAGPVEDVLRVF